MTLSSTSAIAPWMPEFVTTIMPASSDRIRLLFLHLALLRPDEDEVHDPEQECEKTRLPMRFLTIVNGPEGG